MSELPIERLNYFNGQRLEAVDLRLEQDFHIRVQRWLSKSLFSAGVADGLDVSAVEDPATRKKTKVRVREGLALDDLGRAIILVAPVELLPQGRFLCVRYMEHKNRVQEGECAVRGAAPDTVARAKGPERIVSDPEFTWRAVPPANDERELIIAELELAADCTVGRVVSGPRRWAVATQVSKVFTYALEGEKEIDGNDANRKLLRFHVTGRTPNSVSLCLRARQFSTLYYTEMASHKHDAGATGSGTAGKIETDSASAVDSHVHLAGTQLLLPTLSLTAPVHYDATLDRDTNNNAVVNHGRHVIRLEKTTRTLADVLTTLANPLAVAEEAAKFLNTLLNDFIANFTGSKPVELFGRLDWNDIMLGGVTIAGPNGDNQIKGSTGGVSSPVPLHKHDVSVTVADSPRGATGLAPRAGAQFTYFSNLKVSIDGSDPDDTTAAILAQIEQSQSGAWNGQTALNGGVGQPLSTKDGTGLIRLDLLGLPGVSFGPGVHEIEFSVASGTGGCLQYNLYIE